MRRLETRVLLVWALTRLAVVVTVLAGGALLTAEDGVGPFLDRWRQWDVRHYQEIAVGGYDEPPSGTPLAAFFPALPAGMALLARLGVDLTAAGLLVSLTAGAVAVVALGRLAEAERRGAGVVAPLVLVTSPPAVFLAAGYTEALFLSFALPAWLAARRGRWWLAGALVAGAGLVRITGLFLAVALVVDFAVAVATGTRGARWRGVPAVLLGFLGPAAFALFLSVSTGDWLAWVHAQEQGWNRRPTDPLSAFETTWTAAFGGTQAPGVAVVIALELIAVGVGVLLTGWLLSRRRWGEATFVGLQVIALGTSTWYLSVARTALLWWPLWVGLAVAATRSRLVLWAYLAVSVPLSLLLTLTFTEGRWAG